MADDNAGEGTEGQGEGTEGQRAADAVAAMAGGEGGEGSGGEATQRPENVPEKFWDAEKGETRVDDVLKSYGELEGRFGSFTGAPEGDYAVELSDELKEQGVELNADDPVLQEAMKLGKEMGLNQEGFSKFVEIQAMAAVANKTAEDDAMAADIASLGDNADRRLNNLNQWASKNLPTELQEGFKDAAVSADAVKAIEQLVSMTRSAPVQAAEASAAASVTKQELETMQFAKDENGNRKMQNPEYRAEFERRSRAFHGEEPQQIIVG